MTRLFSMGLMCCVDSARRKITAKLLKKCAVRCCSTLLFFPTATLVPQIKQERDRSIFIVGEGGGGVLDRYRVVGRVRYD